MNTTVIQRSTQFLMTYMGGSTCSSGALRQTTIVFTCDRTATPGSSKGLTSCIELPTKCNYECTWPTSIVCDDSQVNPTTPTTAATTTTTTTFFTTPTESSPSTSSTTTRTRLTTTTTTTTTQSTTTAPTTPTETFEPATEPPGPSASKKVPAAVVGGAVGALIIIFAIGLVVGFKWDRIKTFYLERTGRSAPYKSFQFSNSSANDNADDDDDELLQT